MTRSITVLVLILGVGVAAADPTEAEALYEKGQVAFDAQRFDDAIVAWERSYELSKEPGLLFNIGQAYRERGRRDDCAKAFASYQKFIELDAKSDQRSTAEGLMIETKACTAREVPVPVAVPVTAPIAITPPIAAPIVIPVDEAHPGRTKKIVGLAIVGSGAALVATGFYFGHRASSLGDEVTHACRDGCAWRVYGPKHADGQSAQTKQYIFDGLGIAAIIGGGVLYWHGARQETPSKISFTSRRGGAVVTWSSSW